MTPFSGTPVSGADWPKKAVFSGISSLTSVPASSTSSRVTMKSAATNRPCSSKTSIARGLPLAYQKSFDGNTIEA